MTITFKDVSHYQGAYVPTGPTIAKATEGSTYIDPEYGGIRKRTLAGGWAFLPYHFLRHGNIDAQVDHAFGVIGHHSLMLDVETPVAGAADPTLADVYAFADRWKTVTGQQVALAYIPHWYWQGHWGSPSLTGLKSRGIGLISSLYDHGHADDGPGWNPYGGMTPIIWQYTSTPLDTNAFKGTTAQLADLWANGTNPSPEVDMPLTQADADLVVATLVKNDNFQALIWRAAALVNNTDVLSGPDKGDVNELAKAVKAIPGGTADVAAIAKAVNDDAAKRLES